jgi:hypothetical protein
MLDLVVIKVVVFSLSLFSRISSASDESFTTTSDVEAEKEELPGAEEKELLMLDKLVLLLNMAERNYQMDKI